VRKQQKAIKATASLRREHRVDLCELFVDCGASESVPIDLWRAGYGRAPPCVLFMPKTVWLGNRKKTVWLGLVGHFR